jgi:hypothetical protein
VSVYSFIDERDLLFHSLVFSAGERESAYVIDGLMHNDVVRSDIHSTDSFGFSEAIFGVSHLLGFTHFGRPASRIFWKMTALLKPPNGSPVTPTAEPPSCTIGEARKSCSRTWSGFDISGTVQI